LRCTLEQEIYLLRECRNFVVETDVKYLTRMLNNSEKIPNVTINHWIDYIRTNFFFEIVYKKRKTFRPDVLLRRKWYPGNPSSDRFKDSSDDEKDDIPILLEKNQEKMALKLEEFYKDIDLREGFFYEELVKDLVYQLKKQMEEEQESYSNKGFAKAITEEEAQLTRHASYY